MHDALLFHELYRLAPLYLLAVHHYPPWDPPRRRRKDSARYHLAPLDHCHKVRFDKVFCTALMPSFLLSKKSNISFGYILNFPSSLGMSLLIIHPPLHLIPDRRFPRHADVLLVVILKLRRESRHEFALVVSFLRKCNWLVAPAELATERDTGKSLQVTDIACCLVVDEPFFKTSAPHSQSM